MKLGRSYKIAGVLVLGVAAVLLVIYITHIPPQRLAALGIRVSVMDQSETPKPTPSPTPDDKSSNLGTVSVQTFSGPVLVRQGAGTVVSVDGLVLTTVATAPFGAGKYIYQIAAPRGQLLRAQRVASDAALGLVLLKTEAGDLDAVLFTENAALSAGMLLQAVSAQIIASKFVPMRLPVWVVWSDEDRQTLLTMDRSFGPAFNGARLVDASGRSVGLMRNAAQPGLISAARINAFLNRYFGQPAKN